MKTGPNSALGSSSNVKLTCVNLMKKRTSKEEQIAIAHKPKVTSVSTKTMPMIRSQVKSQTSLQPAAKLHGPVPSSLSAKTLKKIKLQP